MVLATDNPERFEQIQATLDAMKHQEATTYSRYRRSRVVAINDNSNAQNTTTARTISIWRQKLTEWMSSLVVKCNLDRSSVALALYYLDASIDGGLCVERKHFQLAAAACLQLALKCRDTAVIQRDKLVALGNGAFTAQDLSNMEFQILTLLNWHLHAPTVYCFLSQYEQLLPRRVHEHGETIYKILQELGHYVADLTLMEEKFIAIKPSVIAYAIQLFVLDLIPSSSSSSSSSSFLPIHSRQTLMLRMKTVGRLSTCNSELLKVFELIKETLCLKVQRLDDMVNYIDRICTASSSSSQVDAITVVAEPTDDDAAEAPTETLSNTVTRAQSRSSLKGHDGSTSSDNNSSSNGDETSPTSISTAKSVSPQSVIVPNTRYNDHHYQQQQECDSSIKSFPGAASGRKPNKALKSQPTSSPSPSSMTERTCSTGSFSSSYDIIDDGCSV